MAANIMFQHFGRQRNERIYRERSNPLDEMSDEELRRRYRFSRESIEYILYQIRDEICPSTSRSHAISAELQLLIALRYYASGSFQEVIGDTVGVEKSTVSRIIRKVSLALSGLLPRYCEWPSGERKQQIKSGFFRLAGFPGVVGCIDGTHVRIQAPTEDEPAYVNRKGFHSINTQAVCDHEGKFKDIVARWPGSTHDAYIFRTSPLKERLETHRGLQDGIILGDSGYACKPYLMTPYIRPSTEAEEKYNAAHKQTRVQIERPFGWLKRRFHVLHGEIRMNPERVCVIIGACVVLHNIALHLKEPLPEEDEQANDDLGDNDERFNQTEDGRRVRDYITRTFFLFKMYLLSSL